VRHYTRVSGTFSKELLGVYSGIATLELMQRYNGYSTLGNIGSEIVSTFNAASSDANVKELVSATALFGGGMFELRFTPKIEMKHAYRRLLTNYLADHGVLLLQGHPSFVCLSHEAIEMHDLYDRFFRAMRSWAKANPDI
jgi:glutamate-1-semialdehyde 2,1-aminomutase